MKEQIQMTQDRKIKNVINSNKAITLIALVVTIIVLLILAGVTIATLTGDNGILTQAGNAKEQTEISNEKEIVETSVVQAMAKSKYGDIEEEKLQNELDNNKESGQKEVLKDINTIYVHFEVSDRYYKVDDRGNVEGPVTLNRAKDACPGDITKDINGKELSGLTEEDAYQINCIEDLCAFSNSGNNGVSYKRKIYRADEEFKF